MRRRQKYKIEAILVIVLDDYTEIELEVKDEEVTVTFENLNGHIGTFNVGQDVK